MISNQDNWNNISLINQSQSELKALNSNIEEYDNLNQLYDEYYDFIEIYDSFNDQEKNELIENLKKLETRLNKLKIQRQALHAKHLSFIHPYTNKSVEFNSSVPGDILDLFTVAAIK